MSQADGQLIHEEREIIVRKAEKLSLDVDEVEMCLEGRLASSTISFNLQIKINNSSKTLFESFYPSNCNI